MTTPDIQTCAAVRGFSCPKCGYVGQVWQHENCGYLPLEQHCGAPVAAIGPCAFKYYDDMGPYLCGFPASEHGSIGDEPGDDHDYEGKLVHVEVSDVCGGCGRMGKNGKHSGADTDADILAGRTPCIFAPTIKEVASDHEAVVDAKS